MGRPRRQRLHRDGERRLAGGARGGSAAALAPGRRTRDGTRHGRLEDPGRLPGAHPRRTRQRALRRKLLAGWRELVLCEGHGSLRPDAAPRCACRRPSGRSPVHGHHWHMARSGPGGRTDDDGCRGRATAVEVPRGGKGTGGERPEADDGRPPGAARPVRSLARPRAVAGQPGAGLAARGLARRTTSRAAAQRELAPLVLDNAPIRRLARRLHGGGRQPHLLAVAHALRDRCRGLLARVPAAGLQRGRPLAGDLVGRPVAPPVADRTRRPHAAEAARGLRRQPVGVRFRSGRALSLRGRKPGPRLDRPAERATGTGAPWLLRGDHAGGGRSLAERTLRRDRVWRRSRRKGGACLRPRDRRSPGHRPAAACGTRRVLEGARGRRGRVS